MRKTIIFILPIVVLFLFGCSRSNLSARLVEVDSLLSAELNDSAYHVIETIKEKELLMPGERAYYQLLKTRTYILNGKSLTNDNIIDSAITYYQQHPNPERLANCYYYKAALLFDKNDINKYVFNLKKAENIAEDAEDDQIKYKIYDAISYANNLNGSYDIALCYAQKEFKIAQKCHNNSWIAYAYFNIGYAYLEQGKVDSALYYFDKTEPYIKYVQKKDRPYFLSNLSLVYIDNYPQKSKKLLLESISYKPVVAALNQLAGIYYDEGNLEEAYNLLEKALTIDDATPKDAIIHNLLEYDVEHGHIDKVCDRVNDIIAIKDSIISQLKNDTIKDLQTRFDQEVVVNAANKKLIYWQWVVGALVIFVLCLCLFMMWYRNQTKLKLKDRQIRLSQLTNQVSILELRKNQAETQMAKLEKDKLADIQQLKDQMALAEQEKAEYERQIKEWTGEESAKLRLGIDLYGKIENNEKVQSWGNEQYEAFIAYYDTINHQAFKKMLKGYEKLTLQNTFYLILKDMGKSKDDICSIMSLEKSSLRSIESRLRAKEIRR